MVDLPAREEQVEVQGAGEEKFTVVTGVCSAVRWYEIRVSVWGCLRVC